MTCHLQTGAEPLDSLNKLQNSLTSPPNSIFTVSPNSQQGRLAFVVPAEQPVCPGPHKRHWVSLTAGERLAHVALSSLPSLPTLAPPLRPPSLSQDHLQHCSFQAVPCPNESCREAMLRKDVKEHLSASCRFREEKCLYCKRDIVVTNLQVRAGSTMGGHQLRWSPEGHSLLIFTV